MINILRKKLEGRRYDTHGALLHTREYCRGANHYELKFYDVDGKLRTTTAHTLSELRSKKKEIELFKTYGKHTLDQIARIYFKSAKKRVSKNTLIGYLKKYDDYIAPDFGTKDINKIKPGDIERFCLMLHEEKGLSVNTIEGIHSVLHAILDAARKECMMGINPADNGTKCLSIAKKREQATKPEAIPRAVRDNFLLFLVTKCVLNCEVLIVYLLAKTGCRYGEIAGLRDCDIDYDGRLIDINHTLSYGYRSDELDTLSVNNVCGFSVSEAKTVASKRTIPVSDDWLMEQLHNQAGKNKRVKRISIDGYKGFLFVKSNGLPYSNKNVNSFITRSVRQYNAFETSAAAEEQREPLLLSENITCHTFRRTAATLLLYDGYQVPDIQYLLGHVDTETTNNRYCCPSLDRAREVAKCLN